MFLLDTNVISEFAQAGRWQAEARVAAGVSGRDATSFYISALTLIELEMGILRIERCDAGKGERLRTWMDRSARCPSTRPWPVRRATPCAGLAPNGTR